MRAIRQLPTIQRSIVLENRGALMRRWRLARQGAIQDPRLLNRYFPKQRALFELLGVMEQHEVEQMAGAPTPLFRVNLRCTEFLLEAVPDHPITDPLEQAAVEESFVALSARLDAIKTSSQQACLLYDMTSVEASWLSRFCPQEVKLLARDPSLVLVQAATDEFLTASATRKLTSKEQVMFSSVSRRTQAAVV
jgi:hypothetical protein